jgi:alanyl-tRNA synthetase
VSEWILAGEGVRAVVTTRDEAERLGAMALFGEKYGDVVRMVEVGDGSFSRELCGGTHVHRTAEIGLFKVTTETSSAANVRRIEALTGPVAVELMRSRDAELERLAKELRTSPGQVEDAVAKLREAAKADATATPKPEVSIEDVLARADEVDGARRLVADVPAADEKQLLELLDRLKPKLGDAAIVLGAPGDGRVMFVASVAPALVERGVKAGAIVKAAAEVTGGGGGGRDTMARAGGRDPAKLGDALDAARAAIADALS